KPAYCQGDREADITRRLRISAGISPNMPSMARARSLMVEAQVRTNDVTDARIIEAMSRLPRERFVSDAKRHLAYSDACIALSAERFLLDPRTFSKLAQLAEIGEQDRVLDVACGTGYSTAVF